MQENRVSHLVILVHGLHGSASNLENIKKLLSEKHNSIYCFCCISNDGFLKTHDGIDVAGKRIANEVIQLISDMEKENLRVNMVSFIGHSLGGLICRYAIGILFEREIFKNCIPMNFITLATPHVGSRRTPRGILNPLISWFTTTFLSNTGNQLMLEDCEKGIPVLLEMSQKDRCFYKGLSQFKNLILYSNIHNDFQVPFSTSSILERNPFLGREKEIVFSKNYPFLIELDAEFIESKNLILDKSSISSDMFAQDKKKEYLVEILSNLQTLVWRRVAVAYDSIFCHEEVAYKQSWMKDNVIRHLMDHFLVE